MRYNIKTLVVLLLLAIMPLRALATVTIGFCALHQQGVGSDHVGHDHHNHDHGNAPPGHGHDDCNSCVEHCASAAVVAPVELPGPPRAGAHRIATPERFGAGFVPDPLDPPPLAS